MGVRITLTLLNFIIYMTNFIVYVNGAQADGSDSISPIQHHGWKKQYPFLACITGWHQEKPKHPFNVSETGPVRSVLGIGMIVNHWWVLAPASVVAKYEPYGIDSNLTIKISFFPYVQEVQFVESENYYKRYMTYEYTVKYVVVHKQYEVIIDPLKPHSNARTRYDISLLRTKSPIRTSSLIKLPHPNAFLGPPKSYDSYYVTRMWDKKCVHATWVCGSIGAKLYFYTKNICKHIAFVVIPINISPHFKHNSIRIFEKSFAAYRPENYIARQFPAMKGGVVVCGGPHGWVLGLGTCFDCNMSSIYDYIFPHKLLVFSHLPEYMNFINYTIGYGFVGKTDSELNKTWLDVMWPASVNTSSMSLQVETHLSFFMFSFHLTSTVILLDVVN